MSRAGLGWSIFAGAAVCGLAVAAVLALAIPAPGHTPLHIGCRHHNHGAKWHADHGHILGSMRGERIRVRAPDREALAARSLTFGRPGSRAASAVGD